MISCLQENYRVDHEMTDELFGPGKDANLDIVHDHEHLEYTLLPRTRENIRLLAKTLKLEFFNDEANNVLSLGGQLLLLDIHFEEEVVKKTTLCYADENGSPVQLGETADQLLYKTLVEGPDSMQAFAENIRRLTMMDRCSAPPKTNYLASLRQLYRSIQRRLLEDSTIISAALDQHLIGLQIHYMRERPKVDMSGLPCTSYYLFLDVADYCQGYVPNKLDEDGEQSGLCLVAVLDPPVVLPMGMVMHIESLSGKSTLGFDFDSYLDSLVLASKTERVVYTPSRSENYSTTLYASHTAARRTERIPLTHPKVLPQIIRILQQALMYETILSCTFGGQHAAGVNTPSNWQPDMDNLDDFLEEEDGKMECSVSADIQSLSLGFIADRISFSLQVLVGGKVIVQKLLIQEVEIQNKISTLEAAIQTSQDLCISVEYIKQN